MTCGIQKNSKDLILLIKKLFFINNHYNNLQKKPNSMKKVAKVSWISLCCLCPIVLVTSFATNWKQQANISCVGSSGVKPFIELVSSNYSNHPFDITVEAGGSGFGIEELVNDHCNIGTTSTNPYVLVNNNQETAKA